jgi:hypothetical protein
MTSISANVDTWASVPTAGRSFSGALSSTATLSSFAVGGVDETIAINDTKISGAIFSTNYYLRKFIWPNIFGSRYYLCTVFRAVI